MVTRPRWATRPLPQCKFLLIRRWQMAALTGRPVSIYPPLFFAGTDQIMWLNYALVSSFIHRVVCTKPRVSLERHVTSLSFNYRLTRPCSCPHRCPDLSLPRHRIPLYTFCNQDRWARLVNLFHCFVVCSSEQMAHWSVSGLHDIACPGCFFPLGVYGYPHPMGLCSGCVQGCRCLLAVYLSVCLSVAICPSVFFTAALGLSAI